MPNPKVKQIYDTLKEGGADVGSEKEFNDYFFAKGKDGYNNRKAIFDTLKEGGADAGDTYEDFAGWLGLHAVRPEETAKSAASATSGTTPISSSNRQTTRKGTSMTDAEKASMISNMGGIVRNSQAGLQRSNNMITYAKKKTGLRIAPVSIGHNPNVVETVKQYNPRTGKIQARYLTETGNEYDDKVQAGIEQTAIDEQKRRELDPVQSQLEDAYSERERLEKAVSARRKELEDDYKSKPWYQRALMEMGKAAHSDLDPAATAADSEHMGFEQDKQYMQLMAAIRKNHQTIQTLEDKKNGQMNSFWHSLGTALTNGYTFADGLPELRDATAMLNAQKHIDSINRKRQTGRTLTKEEEAAEAVLHNTQTDNAIQGAYGSEYGAWGRAGSGMAQSIDFMKDFLLLPGAGSIAKGVAGKVAKVGGSFLAKKAGESAVKATAKAIARATLKATGVVAGAHTAGAVISNTTGIGRTAAKMGQLSAGDVSMDENGNYKIENQQYLMRAFVEAEREQAGENGSEMFGEFIPGGKVLSAASKKALSKIGLGRISDMLTSIGNKAWYKNYTTLLSKGGYNGIPGEALEEYEGMFFDAITGHADEAIQELTDPKQQVDIWLGCATMGALMGAIPMGLHVQGYYRYKHGMNRADKTADFRLTPEKWQPLKEQIDQTDNGNMSEFVVDNILNNNNLETQEKEAALDYVRNLTKFRGFNIAQVNNADEAAKETQAAGVDPQNEERRQHDEYRQEAYEMGRNAASVVEAEGDRSDADAIVLRQREAYDEIERVFADDAEMRLAQLEDDPWEVMNDQSLTPEQQDAVAYFVNSKAAMEGLNDAVIENSENKGDEVARQIEKRTNKQSGMIHPATLKADDKQVYIVSGSVSMFADGSAVDIQNSSESIVVCDAETGELKFISPEQIYKVDAPVDPSVELKAADETIKAERQAIWGDTEETPEQVDSDQSQQQDVADEETNYEEQNESEENIPQSEPVLQDNIDSEVNLPHNEADTHEVSALSRIPKGEQGEPLLEQTDPETAWDGVVEYMENADDAQEYVESMVTKLAKDVDNATKAVSKIKPTGDIAQFKADKAAARQVQADAEARLEQWKQIANVNTERTKAEKAVEQEQRAVREAEIHQQAVKAEELRQHEELQKQAEQDARGANNVAHAIREKWDIAPKIDGAPNEIVLPNGERVNGHYVLTESGAVSPSHNATAEFVKTEGFPIDENGQSVNDRDYERDKDAQNVTRDIARNYDSRAMQSPVVVSKDGVVLSGNGRTMAGELAAANNTDGAYIEHLQKYPQQFGFTPEQVQGMQHPRVVFVPDADMPYNAETFAKFNQQEMKAQSKTEQAVKLGKIVDDATLAHITRAINSYETLGEFYADHKATRAAIRELQAAGVLSQAQIAEMFDGEGISAQGKEVLENMLIGKAFESNPDAIREITEFKSVRQSVITALAEIINNKSLGDDYSLEHELSQAVDLVYKARKANHKAGDRVSSYARQQNLFTFDEGDTVADYTNSVMLMLADVLNDSRSTRLKKILAVYNDKAAYSAVGQTDMFADGGIQNKEQIWNDVKQLIDYGTETEQQQAISEATERRKESVREDESFGRSDERSGEIADVKLSDEVDEDGSPFIETSHGSTIFGEIKKESGLTPAPIKLSLGNSKYGLIHIEKRHGDQIRNAGFISVEEFVEFVCKNYKQIKQGENSLGENNGTYLIQIEDEHNNTLYVELSTDNKYWSVNSGGVFRKGYGKNKKEVWSASEVQSKQSATNSTLREEELSDKPTTPNGNVPTTSMGKDSQTSDTKQEKEDKFTPSAKKEGENIIDYATRVAEENDAYKARKAEEAKVNTSPTNAQKEAGNYKKGHIRVDGLDFTIEQPKGSIRRGKDADGKEWESKMHNTYGYIRGTEGVDGDHIDIYLSDNPAEGNVFVIDQVNSDGSFDEHKVMYGFPDRESAKQAYLSNYEDGWQGLGNITEVSKEGFKKWVDSSTRKTKPFAEYKGVKSLGTERTQLEEKSDRKIQGFEDYSEEEIIDALKGDVEMILEDSGIDDVEIKDIAIHGSRVRGTAREDSDLDVVVEYSGDWKEDSLFNVLHEDEHTFEGIKVDFNPIREEESGSMQNYMKRSAAYDKDQLEKVAVAHISEEIMHDDIPAMTEEEYLASKGLASPMTDYTLDKTRIPHGETARQEAKRKREAEKVIEEYAAQKETARKEYRKKIANGELREPTKEEAEQKRIDVLIKTANGHEDNPSVQAARRVLAKRGIEWKKNEDVFARAEQIAQDTANLKEMETYWKHTDTSGRTAINESKYDSEALFAPLTLDGKPSKLAVMTVVPGKITDPTGQIAVYDYSDEIDEKTNDGWQKWGDLADEYNKTADTNNKAHERGDEASLGFASVDAAVKFNDWLKERDNGNDTVTPESTVNSKGKASDFADGTTVAGKVVAQTKESVTIEQNGRRYDIRAKDLIEQSDKPIAAPKREYQKGNHVAANVTTEQRLATDAVLSLLDKAGVPVEIVSDETAKEIIPENAEKRIVYHGSSAKFEQFDHSHMGEGEGAQAYGWGSYVTEVEGIGRSYAVGNGKIKFRGFVLESMHSLEVKEHFSEAERKVLNFLYRWVKRSDNVSTAIEKAREWASNEYGKYSGRRDWSDQNYKDYFGAISKRDVSEWRKEMKEKEENAQQMLSFIETVSVDDFSLPQRHLYTVDIPDDTGSNYLSWEQPMTVEQLNAIEAYLKENFRANRVQVFTDGITKSTASNSEEVDAFTRRGENIYHLLEHILYDDKSVSEMLHSLGYTGISYPAEHQSGGREDGARNYVVFNEKDLKITDHVQFMKTPQGTVYGWTVGGKIYLTKTGLNPETPIHEYTHIWANAMRVHNAEGWNSIKDLLKDTPVWAQVLNDPNYSDIKDDEDAVASEVLSRISGKENGKKFEEQANQMLEQTHGILEKARVTTLINNVRRALNKFWSWIGKNLFAIEKFGSIDEVTNRVLYDLVNATPLQTDAARDKAEMQVGREENIDAVNARFNEELEQQITGKQEAGHVYELGMPGEVLQSTGVPFVPIQMNATRLAEKATRFGHDFDLSEIKDLVKSIQQPLAIFSYGNKDKAQNIVVEIQHENKNFIVGLSLRPTIDGRILEINSIRNVFPKDNAEWLNWITQGKLLYADKEKIQALINQQRTILADVDYLDLDSAANIVKDFVNPNIGEEKTSLQGKIAPQDTTPQAKALQAKVLSEKLNTPIRVVSDPEVIAGLPSRRQQRAKGWWSTKNDEVVILLPNNTDAADVANTAVHEVVGHKGLRKLIGEERFGEFLDEVHGHASNRVRAAIDQIERKLFDAEVDRLTQLKNAEPARPESRKGFFSRAEATVEANEKRVQMRREATEEYMADMAGRIGDDGFENMSAEELTFWGKVKAKVQQFLDKFLRGLKIAKGIKLTDKDVAYILYKSWKNMRNGGKPTIVDMAEDAMMRNKTHYNEADLVRFRDGNSVEYNKALARDLYEQRIKRGLYQTQEAIQDSMLSLKEAMRAILKAEGSNIDKIEDVADYENPYLGENRLSSVNQAECSAFAQTLFKPMLEEVARLTNNATERSELIDYMMAKHGLERNDVMAMRFANNMTNEKYSKQLNEAERAVAADPLDQDAKDALDDLKQRIQDYRDILYAENRGVDYAGLTALTGMDNVTDAENEANKMVSEYEANHDTTNLWAMINAVTKATLQKTYESGIISKAVYDDISNMYKNYIPLRGFDETTSEEAYAYLSDTNGAFNAPIKTAKGRTSKADDPFANMEAMAESAIMQGNRNILVKRKFMRFAQNHPSDLVSINDLWLRYDDVSGEWRPVNTGDIKGTEFIEENDTPADVERKMRDFETAIQQLSITDPDHFKRQKDYPNIPYRVVGDRDLRQHQVLIKQGGKDYVLTINGNPRVAQALNGLTNPDNDTSGALGAILHLSEAINRQLSAFYTTRNPDFIVSNFMRDMLYANTMVWVKESPNYALNFHKNFAKLNPVMMKSLLTKLRNGTLDMNNETEKAFSLFIANGGETGYANIRDIEQRKNDIKRELRKHNGKLPIAKALSILGERFDEYNRAVENCARFAAFITSYKMKRSIGRCVYDAKEISVNFNKKGSGAKFMGKTGQSKSGNVAAFVSGFGRSSYVFWNAAIQGTTNFGRQFKRHPEKAIAGAAVMFLLGAIVAWLEGDSDDKDGKNNYYDLPEYTRRSNIIFRIPGMDSWISIPLPVEYRALYGMGELMAGVIGDKEHYTTGELSSQIAGQVSQALPIDFMEGGGGFKAFVPSSIKPYAEVLTNKSWTGMPIYKKTPWNKDMPEWTKAYKSANKQLVGFFKLLNEISGGDPYTSGVIDINPAQAEYLLNGYFGGVSSTIDKFAKMGETALGQREYDPRSFLILNRLVKSGDERTEYRRINNEYSRLEQEHDKLKARLKHYEEDTYNGVFDYAEKINWINKSPEYQRLLIFEKYSSDINAINKELKETIDEESRKKLEALNYQLKQAMVDEANKTRK